jgi:hypothetical protein
MVKAAEENCLWSFLRQTLSSLGFALSETYRLGGAQVFLTYSI